LWSKCYYYYYYYYYDANDGENDLFGVHLSMMIFDEGDAAAAAAADVVVDSNRNKIIL
jgi:hypothetical protein